jgi:transposase
LPGAGASPSRGYVFLHHAVDGHPRLAYSEILADERKETAAAFWKRARAIFTAHGITFKAVHRNTPYSAAVDDHGRLLGQHELPANGRGYADLLSWVEDHGDVAAVGVESTGSFGAALAGYLTAHEVRVVEVNWPNGLARHMDGKSDLLGTEQIAPAALGQRH